MYEHKNKTMKDKNIQNRREAMNLPNYTLVFITSEKKMGTKNRMKG